VAPSRSDILARLLAGPREAGTATGAAARELLAGHLEATGWQVERQRFTFTPSAVLGLPVFGAGLGGLGLLLLPALTGTTLPGWTAILLLGGGLGALVGLALGVGLGWVRLGSAEREDANLVATRGAAPVRRWIVAHLDTKAQAQSMAGRLIAVWCLAVVLAGLLGASLLRLRGPLPLAPVSLLVGLAVLTGALAGRGRLKGSSAGARDNGSGIAGLLAAAESMVDEATGLLVTGAEEFGLVGARIFTAQRREGLAEAVVVNLDTIDQEGELALVSHDRRGEALARRLAPVLAAAGVPARLRRLPAGILTDSVPFARAGIPAVTIGRLTWRTLRLIHTPRDTAEGLSLEMAERVGRAVGTN
jgi:hypothetical protein